MPPSPVHHHHSPPPPFPSQTLTPSPPLHHPLSSLPSSDPLPPPPSRHESSPSDSSHSLLHFSSAVSDDSRLSLDPHPPPDTNHPSHSPLSLSRCSSSGSIVTHSAASEGFGSSVDQPSRDTDSSETHWTDDKHRSYLTLMEENFVKDLYDREYCALDVCGQAPCSHSDATSAQSQLDACEFKSWRNGDWQWISMPKRLRSPQMPLFQNPWINHFRQPSASPHTSRPAQVAGTKDYNTVLPGENQRTMISMDVNSPSGRIPFYQTSTLKSSDRSYYCNNAEIHHHQHEEEDMMMSGNPKANPSNREYATSFLNSRKRGQQAEHAELRMRRRQRFADDGHSPR